ncbi:MAG: cation:proton antiporter, partial [Methylococcales bacterium]
MVEQPLMVLLLLLGVAVTVSLLFQRLHIPASLGYLLVGVVLGPHTAGPVIDERQIGPMAELGIVFLLFTIGLSFSLSQIYALRHLVLGLGTVQVLLTTAVVALAAFGIGLPPAAAFVVGTVFAQSSTTIISKQLAEQGETHTRTGRMAIAMNVFQDVTAVPFLVVIPVLGFATAQSVADSLLLALGKAVLALTLVFLVGRWLLRPIFHFVAERRSAELFTLTVLFVSLSAAWATNSLGLSMPFGAFLVGMMLGETEFRHQVEATIRPFRDVLLGLFFVTIGMLFDPHLIPEIWLPALASGTALLAIKIILVGVVLRLAGFDKRSAVRIGLLLAVGGEFGFALLAIALDAGVIAPHLSQIVLMAVLFSMIVAPFLIRYNEFLTSGLSVPVPVPPSDPREADNRVRDPVTDHVIICGFGRIGQSVGRFLEIEKIPYIALDLDAARVREARIAGQPVHYADSSDR